MTEKHKDAVADFFLTARSEDPEASSDIPMQSFTFEDETRIGKVRFNEKGIGEGYCPECKAKIRVEASSIFTMANRIMVEGWNCENCGAESEPYSMADFYDDQFAEGDTWEDETEE